MMRELLSLNFDLGSAHLAVLQMITLFLFSPSYIDAYVRLMKNGEYKHTNDL